MGTQHWGAETMFFTHLGRVIAILALILGAMRIILGVLIAEEFLGPYEAALARYGRASSAGEVINTGVYVVLLGVTFGTLTEISYALWSILKAQ
jgi:hypothetical protein